MLRNLLVVVLTVLLTAGLVHSQEFGHRIPVKYLFTLGGLESGLDLLQPQRIRYDRSHQEFYITDTGHNRIVILDSLGSVVYEIKNQDRMQAPTDVAVDKEGLIYVLSSPGEGIALQVYDYNGDYLRPFQFRGGPAADSIEIGSLAIDDHDLLYLADSRGARILAYDLSGNFQLEFPIIKDMNEKDRRDLALGSLYLNGDFIYLPAPMIGTVCCYDKQGSLVRMIGRSGGGYGELAFPMAVTLDNQGNILVLDKHRHTVVSYDSTGKVNGEFGGFGTGPGWFYHPISLLVDSRNRAWVAQGFGNRIQALQLPIPQTPAPMRTENLIVDR